MEVVAQIVGIVAMGLGVLSFQAKESKKILIIQTIANIIWSTHYFLLNSMMGFVLNIYSAIRNATYYFLNKKESDNNKGAITVLFIVCFALGIIFPQILINLSKPLSNLFL